MDLSALVADARDYNDLVRISRTVSTEIELASVAHALDGELVLFENIRDHLGWRVLTGVCADRKRIARALGIESENLSRILNQACENPSDPSISLDPECHQVIYEDVDLDQIPILRHVQEDGGRYITSAVVVVEDPEHGPNLAYHRLLQLDSRRFTGRIVENRGTHNAIRKTDGDLACAICVGVPIQVNLAAAMSVPAGLDEMRIANSIAPLSVTKCISSDLRVPAQSESVLEGRITTALTAEGPFPDLTATMDGVRQQPIIEIDLITRRWNPIYHALLPAGLEHKVLMGMPREPTIMSQVNQVADCIDVLVTPGGTSWLHAIVKINKQQADDGLKAINAAFEGHRSLKHVVIVDSDIDIHDSSQVEWAIATRFQADRDLMVMHDQPGSSLDPSGDHQAGRKSQTSKMGLDATVPLDANIDQFKRVAYPGVDLKEWLSE
ncbi:MAG: UbiD family decarboxylase [Chloroflexota bacterium]